MKIEHLPCLDGEVYYEDHQDGHSLTLYYKSTKKPWQFWKPEYRSHFFWHTQESGDVCDQLTTSQGTYHYDGKQWVKHNKVCNGCGEELIVGSWCQMCLSLISEAKKHGF